MARLKKGSAAAKAWGRKMQRLRGSSKKSRSNSPTKRRRKSTTKSKTYAMARKKRRSYKRSAKVLGINLSKVAAPMIYGAMRQKVSNYLMKYTNKIPLGNVSDEVGMLAASWAAKKYIFKGRGVMRDALTIGQGIELARVGEAAINGQLGINLPGMDSTQTTTSSGYVFN